MPPSIVYLGLDVHKDSVMIAVLPRPRSRAGQLVADAVARIIVSKTTGERIHVTASDA